MKTAKCCQSLCLLMVLVLVLSPGAWAQTPGGKPGAPAAKQDKTAAENATPEEEFDRPIRPGPNPMNVATDALILRPVGLVMIPVTAIIYVIGYPFAKASGSQEEAYQALVGDTIDYTFKRPLGEGAPFE
jgi:hypothetical protein